MSSTPTEGQDYYFNAEGLLVMTEAAHHARGYCCGNHCLHCPYEFEAVRDFPPVVGTVEIRRASVADAAELALLARQTFASTYLKYQDDVGGNLVPYLAAAFAPEKLAASLAKADKFWWVAADARGRLWGYAKLAFEARGGHPGREAHLQRLYVRKQARGHRIGASLLHEVEAFAKTRHAPQVWLTTLSAERAAQDFYPAYGYRFVEEVYYALGSQTFALSVLEKAL